MKHGKHNKKRSPLRGNRKFAKVMREFHKGMLHHGSTGKIVKDIAVARAIAASEQRKDSKRNA